MSAPGTGLEGMAAQAGGLEQNAAGLRAQVDSGQVVMDPEAAENLAKFYEDKADKLNFALMSADRLVAVGAYGNCNIGRDIEQKFSDKAEHPEAGAVPILRRVIETLNEMARTVRDAKRDTQNTDDDNARQLGRNL